MISDQSLLLSTIVLNDIRDIFHFEQNYIKFICSKQTIHVFRLNMVRNDCLCYQLGTGGKIFDDKCNGQQLCIINMHF